LANNRPNFIRLLFRNMHDKTMHCSDVRFDTIYSSAYNNKNNGRRVWGSRAIAGDQKFGANQIFDICDDEKEVRRFSLLASSDRWKPNEGSGWGNSEHWKRRGPYGVKQGGTAGTNSRPCSIRMLRG